jgi:hypothetical protein
MRPSALEPASSGVLPRIDACQAQQPRGCLKLFDTIEEDRSKFEGALDDKQKNTTIKQLPPSSPATVSWTPLRDALASR